MVAVTVPGMVFATLAAFCRDAMCAAGSNQPIAGQGEIQNIITALINKISS